MKAGINGIIIREIERGSCSFEQLSEFSERLRYELEQNFAKGSYINIGSIDTLKIVLVLIVNW